MRYTRGRLGKHAGLLALLLGTAIGWAQDAPRTWTSRAGDTLRASFVRQAGDYAVLQAEDGRTVQIAIARLSDADQAYLRGLAAPGPGGDATAEEDRIPEATVTRIRCEMTEIPTARDVPFVRSAASLQELRGAYHYDVWLPAGYHANPTRRWPSMFIASPGGDARMGRMADWLRTHNYIVIMLVESRNGPVLPMIGNFLAAHDDAARRFRLHDAEKIATGFSGGARAASMFVQLRPGFRGLILQGAGASQAPTAEYQLDGVRRNRAMRVAMIMGETDANLREIQSVEAALRSRDRFRAITFAGGHTWAPAEPFAEAVNWVVGR